MKKANFSYLQQFARVFLIRMNFIQKSFSKPLLGDTPKLLLRVFIETWNFILIKKGAKW